jgi:hypothetical protein
MLPHLTRSVQPSYLFLCIVCLLLIACRQTTSGLTPPPPPTLAPNEDGKIVILLIDPDEPRTDLSKRIETELGAMVIYGWRDMEAKQIDFNIDAFVIDDAVSQDELDLEWVQEAYGNHVSVIVINKFGPELDRMVGGGTHAMTYPTDPYYREGDFFVGVYIREGYGGGMGSTTESLEIDFGFDAMRYAAGLTLGSSE